MWIGLYKSQKHFLGIYISKQTNIHTYKCINESPTLLQNLLNSESPTQINTKMTPETCPLLAPPWPWRTYCLEVRYSCKN